MSIWRRIPVETHKGVPGICIAVTMGSQRRVGVVRMEAGDRRGSMDSELREVEGYVSMSEWVDARE